MKIMIFKTPIQRWGFIEFTPMDTNGKPKLGDDGKMIRYVFPIKDHHFTVSGDDECACVLASHDLASGQIAVVAGDPGPLAQSPKEAQRHSMQPREGDFLPPWKMGLYNKLNKKEKAMIMKNIDSVLGKKFGVEALKPVEDVQNTKLPPPPPAGEVLTLDQIETEYAALEEELVKGSDNDDTNGAAIPPTPERIAQIEARMQELVALKNAKATT